MRPGWPQVLKWSSGIAKASALLAVAITPFGTAQIGTEIRDLIRQMSLDNPLWGAPPPHTASCSSSASRSAKPRSGDTCRGRSKVPSNLA
jgi:hypothetical protein